jgi:hypothetical protein
MITKWLGFCVAFLFLLVLTHSSCKKSTLASSATGLLLDL